MVFIHIGVIFDALSGEHARSNDGALRGHEKTRNFRYCIVYACIGKGFWRVMRFGMTVMGKTSTMYSSSRWDIVNWVYIGILLYCSRYKN